MDIESIRRKIVINMPRSQVQTLKWQRVSEWCIKSECGRFTIGKLLSTPLRDETRIPHYEAWMRIDPKQPPIAIAYRLESADEARSLCEAHSRAQGQESPLSPSPAPMSDQERLGACK